MNTCEWAIQGRLVHCHHTGEPHDHPPHRPNLSLGAREAIIWNYAWKCRMGFMSLSVLSASVSSSGQVAFPKVWVLHHHRHEQGQVILVYPGGVREP